ncbi:hypothetical protein AGMMS49949_09680 [Alphaproteobacteria bacterium]|nr:hypothetical protein AGMMS49949_09680 [Alphaproteobacteria bacterium]GHS96794.1 hypothetical protein AGMMS50296_3260 [Alphaproteobacteria bacterium]
MGDFVVKKRATDEVYENHRKAEAGAEEAVDELETYANEQRRGAAAALVNIWGQQLQTSPRALLALGRLMDTCNAEAKNALLEELHRFKGSKTEPPGLDLLLKYGNPKEIIADLWDKIIN